MAKVMCSKITIGHRKASKGEPFRPTTIIFTDQIAEIISNVSGGTNIKMSHGGVHFVPLDLDEVLDILDNSTEGEIDLSKQRDDVVREVRSLDDRVLDRTTVVERTDRD
jgi:hypothetical protein